MINPFEWQAPPEPELVRYAKLTLYNQSVILDVEEIGDWIREEILNNDPGTVYTIEPVDMTVAEHEAMPEFSGF